MAVAYDTVLGTPHTSGGETSFSVAYTAAAGADVFVAVSTASGSSHTISNVKYGGTAMTQLGSILIGNYGYAQLYRAAGAGTGSALNATGTFSGSVFDVISICSFLGVASVGTAITNTGSTTSVSSGSIATTTGQIALSMLSTGSAGTASMSGAPSGGTNIAYAAEFPYIVQGLNYASTTTTFTATLTGTDPWAAISVVLSGASGTTISPAGASITITGGTSTIVVGGNIAVSPTAATVTVSGATPTVAVSSNVSVSPAPAIVKIAGGNQSPFGNVLTKLAAAQTVNIQFIGDSTTAGYDGDTGTDTGGWVNALGIALGTYFNVTVKGYVINGGYPTGTTLHTGSGSNTINLFNGGVDGEGLAYYESQITADAYLATQFGYPMPDAVFIYDGYNDIGTSLASATWVSDYQTFLTSYMYPNFPNVPIIACTQHTSFESSGDQAVIYADQSAMAAALTGNALPLSPAVQASDSGTYPNTWVLDTQQAFNGYTSAQVMSSNIPHPNLTGYQIIAEWMTQQLAPSVAAAFTWNVSPTPAAVTITGGASTVVLSGNVSISPTSATVTISGGTSTVAATENVSISPTHATISITGGTSTIIASGNLSVSPAPATVVVSGETPIVAITAGFSVSPTPASVAISGGTSTIAFTGNVFITPAPASVAISGVAAAVTISGNIIVSPNAARINISGGTPTVTIADNISLSPAAAIVAVTGGTSTIIVSGDVSIAPTAATITITGGLSIITGLTTFITPAAAVVSISGGIPHVVIASAIIDVAQTVTVAAESRTVVVKPEMILAQ